MMTGTARKCGVGAISDGVRMSDTVVRRLSTAKSERQPRHPFGSTGDP